jgi:hypothetical protein
LAKTTLHELLVMLRDLLSQLAEAEASKRLAPRRAPQPPPPAGVLYQDRQGELFTIEEGRRRPVSFIPYGYHRDPEDGGWWRPWGR